MTTINSQRRTPGFALATWVRREQAKAAIAMAADASLLPTRADLKQAVELLVTAQPTTLQASFAVSDAEGMLSGRVSAAGCQVAGCVEPARGTYCDRHWKQHQRGGLKTDRPQERLEPFEALVKASVELAFCDAEDDRAWKQAADRLKKTAERFARRELSAAHIASAQSRVRNKRLRR